MVERKTDRCAVASALALVVALAACSVDPPTPPIGDTGPYRTVARVDVRGGPTVTTVGDPLTYTAVAYDNANNELPVTFAWHTAPFGILRIDPATGGGRALAAGRASVWATVGSAQSAPRSVTVNSPSTP